MKQALEKAMEEWEDKNRRIKIVKAAVQKNAQNNIISNSNSSSQ